MNLEIFLAETVGTARGVVQRTERTIRELKLDREVLDGFAMSTRAPNLGTYEVGVARQK